MARAKSSMKTTKKAAAKTAVKKAVKKTKGMAKGTGYTCGVCGLSVTVKNPCDCPETAHLVCCEKPMKKSRC